MPSKNHGSCKRHHTIENLALETGFQLFNSLIPKYVFLRRGRITASFKTFGISLVLKEAFRIGPSHISEVPLTSLTNQEGLRSSIQIEDLQGSPPHPHTIRAETNPIKTGPQGLSHISRYYKSNPKSNSA